MGYYLMFDDLFKIVCKKCGSDNVDWVINICNACGSSLDAECHDCKSRYSYHDFIFVEGDRD